MKRIAGLITLLLLLTLTAQLHAAQILVQGVRLSADSDRTRLVFDTAGAVAHKIFTLNNPERLVIDIEDARFPSSMPGPGAAPLIRKMRKGVREGDDLRVVLDLKHKVRAKSFSLPPNKKYGHRLVVDLHPKAAASKQAQDKKSSAKSAAKKSESPKAKPKKPVEAKAVAKKSDSSKAELDKSKTVKTAATKPEKPKAKTESKKSEPVKTAAKKADDSKAKAQAKSEPRKSQTAKTAAKKSDSSKAESKKTKVAENSAKKPAQSSSEQSSSSKRSSSSQRRGRDLVIAIDAGHGGIDPGAKGPTGVNEKDVTLAMARRLEKLIKKEPGMRPVMIRNGDYFVRLHKRIEKARAAKADLFISIHADAFRDRRVRGSSVYTLSQRGASSEAAKWLAQRENRADLVGGVELADKPDLLASVLLDLSMSATMVASREAADDVLMQLRRLGKTHKSDVQHAGFRVLKAPDIPSMLVETAFISNPTEEKRLKDPKHQRRVASALLKGVRNYFRTYPPPGTWMAQQAPRRHAAAGSEALSTIAKH